MKKSVFFSAVTLLVLGLGIGITVSLTEDAHAIWVCEYECLTRTTYTTTTGPLCPGECAPFQIYYITRKAMCTGGPLNCENFYEVVGCWGSSGGQNWGCYF